MLFNDALFILILQGRLLNPKNAIADNSPKNTIAQSQTPHQSRHRQKIRSSVWIVKQIIKFWERKINLSQTDERCSINDYGKPDRHVDG
jgi:hypothetical protein